MSNGTEKMTTITTHNKLLSGSIDALENIRNLPFILLMNRNLSDKRLLFELD
jgi:hypothetical protein